MATCPYCKAHLTEGHRCPKRPAIVIAEIIGSAIVGGLAGLLLFALFVTKDDMDAYGILGGAVLAVSLNRFFRG
jgi:hypothetical protein